MVLIAPVLPDRYAAVCGDERGRHRIVAENDVGRIIGCERLGAMNIFGTDNDGNIPPVETTSKREHETKLDGKAISPERIEADLTPADIKRFGEAGTFEGRITAAFNSQDGQAQITGSRPEVRLELSRSAALDLKQRRGQ